MLDELPDSYVVKCFALFGGFGRATMAYKICDLVLGRRV